MENLFDRHPLATLLGVTVAFAVALIALPTPDRDAYAPDSGAATDTRESGNAAVEAVAAPGTPAPKVAEPTPGDPDSLH